MLRFDHLMSGIGYGTISKRLRISEMSFDAFCQKYGIEGENKKEFKEWLGRLPDSQSEMAWAVLYNTFVQENARTYVRKSSG